MKKLVLLFILFSLQAVHAQQNENSIIGKWITVDDKNQKSLVYFFDDKTAKLSMMGQDIPINEYKIDYSKKPIWIDFIIKNGGQTMTLFALIEFIDANTMKWELFPMGFERQASFTPKKDNSTIILKKQ